MRVKILDKVWTLVFKRLPKKCKDLGYCEGPHIRGKRIIISSKLKGEKKLRIILHEIFHAGEWTKDEEWVHQFSTDVAHILTRLGYEQREEA